MRKVGWKINYKKLKIYLEEKYNVQTAFYFIGYIQENQDLYQSLQRDGYILIFKKVLKYKNGEIKGNVDAELVLQSMIEKDNYEKAVIVSGDGDFSCLVKYLNKIEKLKVLLVPDEKNYSCLLNKAAGNKIAYINRLEKKISKQ